MDDKFINIANFVCDFAIAGKSIFHQDHPTALDDNGCRH